MTQDEGSPSPVTELAISMESMFKDMTEKGKKSTSPQSLAKDGDGNVKKSR